MNNRMDPRSVSWTVQTSELISQGHCALGIELGSTRIKACLVLPDGTPAASGSYEWENALVDGHWSYSLEEVWTGIQSSFGDLMTNTRKKFGVRPTTLQAIGISAMMHGYLAFDAEGNQLVPFRTWRDTYTGEAAGILTDAFGVNIPQRWSVAHYYQSLLHGEEHVPQVRFLTTLAGYLHWQLTGEKVLGVGDASGVFPIDSTTCDYDSTMLATFDKLTAEHGITTSFEDLLPRVLRAGQVAGKLTAEGAKRLDPSGELAAGIRFCPPEGDAGTGMVATNAIKPRTGNISVGTSIFAMIVMEGPVSMHVEIDPVNTPEGLPVAMVHCNNGAQELSNWIELFAEVALAFGKFKINSMDEVYGAILTEALHADPAGGGLLTYNFVSGEPVVGLEDGRPLLIQLPGSSLSLANFIRVQLYSAFATLAIGMKILSDEGVEVDALYAHGGVFRTARVAQRMLAAALDTPVGLAQSASEGGAWGIALLALYLDAKDQSLSEFLDTTVFVDTEVRLKNPEAKDVAGFATYLERFRKALPLEQAAINAFPTTNQE